MKAISFQGNISIEDLSNQRINLDTQLKHSDDQYVRNILPLRIQNFEIKRLEWKDFIGKPDDESPWIAHCYWNNSYEYYFTQDREQVNYREQSPLRLPRIPLQQINQVNQLNVKTETVRTTSVNKIKRLPTPTISSSPQRAVNRSNSSSSLRKQSPSVQKIKLHVKCKLLEKSWAKSKKDDLLLEHETGHYLIGCLSALEFKRKVECSDVMRNNNHQQQIRTIFKQNLREYIQIEKDYDEETNHYKDVEKQKIWNRKLKEQLLLYEYYFNH
ncbi:unnamed protein product (macronuclear) [Paramecium tetraurelia]|uniref:WW domain-containing protein n=1 Tax=Paramecium tetraurelia TaxID=5888 RepID=A0E8H5_PARTE|nr:uncharacterized protein GSPATT00024321001 [Paramecium tetraurelia]CAK91592.1 unnamed protein product [Paramecium tetraurelia]|eukprot:XP_001458989.1 hypothetical protein (macronuclear) [Paramecium tetraurelia strain d4-2]